MKEEMIIDNMTQEEKQLLLQDLCARLPYGVICKMWGSKEENALEAKFTASDYASLESDSPYSLEYCKPYLRPMSSMTDEEKEELYEVSGLICYDGLFTCKKLAKKQSFIADTTDWLNAHHFDYRGLIEKGLALEAPEGMYKTVL